FAPFVPTRSDATVRLVFPLIVAEPLKPTTRSSFPSAPYGSHPVTPTPRLPLPRTKPLENESAPVFQMSGESTCVRSKFKLLAEFVRYRSKCGEYVRTRTPCPSFRNST